MASSRRARCGHPPTLLKAQKTSCASHNYLGTLLAVLPYSTRELPVVERTHQTVKPRWERLMTHSHRRHRLHQRSNTTTRVSPAIQTPPPQAQSYRYTTLKHSRFPNQKPHTSQMVYPNMKEKQPNSSSSLAIDPTSSGHSPVCCPQAWHQNTSTSLHHSNPSGDTMFVSLSLTSTVETTSPMKERFWAICGLRSPSQ